MGRYIQLVLIFLIFSGCITSMEDPCKNLIEIKELPFKGESTDEAYLFILRQGDAVMDCLISKITDITPIKDPRQAPKYEDFVVGDIAIFILSDVTKRPLEEFFPPELQAGYKDERVNAYFKFVRLRNNRKLLQERVKLILKRQKRP